MTTYHLERFTEAQEQMYARALSEVKNAKKCTHWMWYIYPQLRGLGTSTNAYFYGIDGLGEARAYMEHPLLSARLREITEVLLTLDTTDAKSIFGPIDAMKLRSSMTLFAAVSEEGSVFEAVLERYFNGEKDAQTLRLLGLD